MTPAQLRDAREKMNLEPKHLAEILHCTRSFITQMERGTKKIPWTTKLVIEAMMSGWRPKGW